jgi:cytochrome c553
LKRRRLRAAPLLVVLVAAQVTAAAQDLAAGRAKAQACAVCHGVQGLSTQPDAPHLAGQPALYVAAQLRAYRSGARRHEVMGVMAKPLSDADIADLAAWYAAIGVKATLPP